MKAIGTEILINAPIEGVWSTLLDIAAYPNWDPFIRKIEGKLQFNERLRVTIQPPGKKTLVFKPRVIALADYEFAWLGNLLVPGLFDGRHQFQLIKTLDNKVKFIHLKFSQALSACRYLI